MNRQTKFLTTTTCRPTSRSASASIRIDEHTGVLVGGFPDDNAARRALDQMRLSAPRPDEGEARHEALLQAGREGPGQGAGGETVYINPFARAYLVRNPTGRTERPADWDKLDLMRCGR